MKRPPNPFVEAKKRGIVTTSIDETIRAWDMGYDARNKEITTNPKLRKDMEEIVLRSVKRSYNYTASSHARAETDMIIEQILALLTKPEEEKSLPTIEDHKGTPTIAPKFRGTILKGEKLCPPLPTRVSRGKDKET